MTDNVKCFWRASRFEICWLAQIFKLCLWVLFFCSCSSSTYLTEFLINIHSYSMKLIFVQDKTISALKCCSFIFCAVSTVFTLTLWYVLLLNWMGSVFPSEHQLNVTNPVKYDLFFTYNKEIWSRKRQWYLPFILTFYN